MARCLSDEHLKAYKEGGRLKKLFDVIKKDPELSFEIRQDDEVKVYYHKNLILTIAFDRKKEPKITILNKGYYKNGKKPTISFEDPHNLEDEKEMRSYFKEAKKLAYFNKMGAEFIVQQNIALGNQTYNNRYLVVDMEWQFSKADIPQEERNEIPQTKIDLIVVDTIPNAEGINDIYLAELKLGLEATQGKSGTIDHVEKTNGIIKSEKACEALSKDVASIIKQKTELGLLKGPKKDFQFGTKPKMMLIMFYRSDDEEDKLKEECQKARQKAMELKMEEPICILQTALIPLSHNEIMKWAD